MSASVIITITVLAALFVAALVWALYLYVQNAWLRLARAQYLRIINDLVEGDE